jgi:uncharacterized repeat protein (TIGR01451 family)
VSAVKSMLLRTGLLALTAAAILAPQPAAAGAAVNSEPAWAMTVRSIPTVFPRSDEAAFLEGTEWYVITATNVGGAPTDGAVTVTDTLPAGVEPFTNEFRHPYLVNRTGNQATNYPCQTSGQLITCEAPEDVPVGESMFVEIPVVASPSAPDQATNIVSISGGGALDKTASTTTEIGSRIPPFGFLGGEAGFSAQLSAADGSTEARAGAHPYQATFAVGFPTYVPASGEPYAVGEPETFNFSLPRGFYVNPNAVKVKCTETELENDQVGGPGCPQASQVGLALTITRAFGPTPVPFSPKPLYAMAAAPGHPAEFAFDAEAGVYVHVFGHVNADGEYELASHAPNIPAKLPLLASIVTLWGNPTDQSHDQMRGLPQNGVGCIGLLPSEHTCPLDPTERLGTSLLTMPSDCGSGPLSLPGEVSSWIERGVFDHRTVLATDLTGDPVEVSGCNAPQFTPTISSQATTNLADSPTGLDFNLHQPQEGSYEGIATANLKNASVTLPAGLSINPSSANGQSACSVSQVGLTTPVGQAAPIHFDETPQSCPNASKLGTVEVSTPLLEEKLSGAIYLAKPYENPFGNLISIYLAIEDEQTGTIAKLAGKVTPDPVTGQLTATFAENPELPFEDIDLHFFNGAGAALTTPLACGTYTTTSTLTPWSTPEGADAHPTGSFQTQVAAGGSGNCPSSEANAPNKPAFTAGTIAPEAGAYSPFVLKLSRPDGTQRLTGIDTTLPKGLAAKFAGIPYCSEAQIAQAQSRSNPNQGALEQASPSCPAASEVGTVTVGAGSGPTPFYASGHAYLSGPYKGAPLSLAIITPAIAGPFDLGTVVVRTALYVDPETAQGRAVSDPLPSILQGIPLDIRSIAVKLDRPSFTLNPTSCDPMAITGAASALSGQSAALTSPFQVGGCSALKFKPKLKISLKGGTKRHRFPALKAVLTYPKGNYANIASAQVTLPHSAFLEQSHIGTVCTRVQFAANACPKASIYGKARAITPLLDKPLEGPVYLRSSSHELPDLVAALNGQIDVDLVGRIDTGKGGGIRNTFEAVPDAPVSKFVLEMKGGKKGLLVNSEDICRKPQRATVSFTGQNGKASDATPLIANSCGGKAKKKRGSHGKKGHGGKK